MTLPGRRRLRCGGVIPWRALAVRAVAAGRAESWLPCLLSAVVVPEAELVGEVVGGVGG